MYRTGFERICDTLANMQTALSEKTQWIVSALLFLGAGALLVGSF